MAKYHILIGCDEEYAQHAFVMLASLFRNNSGISFHIHIISTHNHLSGELKRYITEAGSECTYYHIDDSLLDGFVVSGHASSANYYRIFLGRLLPESIERILYLDADLVVRKSIIDLFDIDLGNCVLGAVAEYEMSVAKKVGLGLAVDDAYFNSGVLLIDIPAWNRNHLTEQLVEFIRNNYALVEYWDQDALNALLVNRWAELPLTYNYQTGYSFAGVLKDPHIVHYTGKSKPWYYMDKHPFKREYYKYIKYTPWKKFVPEDATVGNFLRKYGLMPNFRF